MPDEFLLPNKKKRGELIEQTKTNTEKHQNNLEQSNSDFYVLPSKSKE